MPRGGRRPGAGAKKRTLGVSRSIAVEVLDRLAELGIPNVKTEADYAIHIMKTDKARAPDFFIEMVNRKHGKPTQAIIAEGKLTIEVVEVGSASRPSAEAGAAQKVM